MKYFLTLLSFLLLSNLTNLYCQQSYDNNETMIVNNSYEPLIVVDGKIWSIPALSHEPHQNSIPKNDDSIKEIDPNDIDHITVLKGQEAMSLYGEKARYGVIIINLKQKNLSLIRP